MTFLIKAWDYTKGHPILLTLIVALLMGGGGFIAGRFTTKPEVREVTKTETKTVTKTEYKDRIVEKVVYVQVVKHDTHVDTTTTTHPDGTTTTHTTEDSHVDEHATNTTDTDETKTGNTTTVVTKVEVKEKLVLQPSNWRVAAGVGLSIPKFLGQPELGVPGMQGAVVNAEVDRRIAGPFWIGVQGTTQGTVSLNLSAVWP